MRTPVAARAAGRRLGARAARRARGDAGARRRRQPRSRSSSRPASSAPRRASPPRIEALHAEEPLSGRLSEDADRFADQAPVVLRYAAESGPRGPFRGGAIPAGGPAGDGPHAPARLLERRPAVGRGLPLPRDPAALRRDAARRRRSARPRRTARAAAPSAEARRRSASRRDGLTDGGRPPRARLRPVRRSSGPSAASSARPASRTDPAQAARRFGASAPDRADRGVRDVPPLRQVDRPVGRRPARFPEVDDLLSLSMDLWAREQGFERIEPGIAGL